MFKLAVLAMMIATASALRDDAAAASTIQAEMFRGSAGSNEHAHSAAWHHHHDQDIAPLQLAPGNIAASLQSALERSAPHHDKNSMRFSAHRLRAKNLDPGASAIKSTGWQPEPESQERRGKSDPTPAVKSNIDAPQPDAPLGSKANPHFNATATAGLQQMPPNIEYLGLGYDLIFGNPHGGARGELDPGFAQRVIALNNGDGLNTQTAGSMEYMVPYGVEIKSKFSCHYSSEARSITDTRSYQTELSSEANYAEGIAASSARSGRDSGSAEASGLGASVSGSHSAGFSSGESYDAAFSASTGYAETAAATEDRDQEVFETQARCTLYEARFQAFAPEAVRPSLPLKRAIDELPDVFTHCGKEDLDVLEDCPEDWDGWPGVQLIKAFGTHYTTSVVFGGKLILRSEVAKSATQAMRSIGVSVEAAAAASAALSTGSSSHTAGSAGGGIGDFGGSVSGSRSRSSGIDASASIDASSAMSQDATAASGFSAAVSRESKINIGGKPVNSLGDWVTWAESIHEQPMPIKYTLGQVSDIVNLVSPKKAKVLAKINMLYQRTFGNYAANTGSGFTVGNENIKGMTYGVLRKNGKAMSGSGAFRATESEGHYSITWDGSYSKQPSAITQIISPSINNWGWGGPDLDQSRATGVSSITNAGMEYLAGDEVGDPQPSETAFIAAESFKDGGLIAGTVLSDGTIPEGLKDMFSVKKLATHGQYEVHFDKPGYKFTEAPVVVVQAVFARTDPHNREGNTQAQCWAIHVSATTMTVQCAGATCIKHKLKKKSGSDCYGVNDLDFDDYMWNPYKGGTYSTGFDWTDDSWTGLLTFTFIAISHPDTSIVMGVISPMGVAESGYGFSSIGMGSVRVDMGPTERPGGTITSTRHSVPGTCAESGRSVDADPKGSLFRSEHMRPSRSRCTHFNNKNFVDREYSYAEISLIVSSEDDLDVMFGEDEFQSVRKFILVGGKVTGDMNLPKGTVTIGETLGDNNVDKLDSMCCQACIEMKEFVCVFWNRRKETCQLFEMPHTAETRHQPSLVAETDPHWNGGWVTGRFNGIFTERYDNAAAGGGPFESVIITCEFEDLKPFNMMDTKTHALVGKSCLDEEHAESGGTVCEPGEDNFPNCQICGPQGLCCAGEVANVNQEALSAGDQINMVESKPLSLYRHRQNTTSHCLTGIILSGTKSNAWLCDSKINEGFRKKTVRGGVHEIKCICDDQLIVYVEEGPGETSCIAQCMKAWGKRTEKFKENHCLIGEGIGRGNGDFGELGYAPPEQNSQFACSDVIYPDQGGFYRMTPNGAYVIRFKTGFNDRPACVFSSVARADEPSFMTVTQVLGLDNDHVKLRRNFVANQEEGYHWTMMDRPFETTHFICVGHRGETDISAAKKKPFDIHQCLGLSKSVNASRTDLELRVLKNLPHLKPYEVIHHSVQEMRMLIGC